MPASADLTFFKTLYYWHIFIFTKKGLRTPYPALAIKKKKKKQEEARGLLVLLRV